MCVVFSCCLSLSKNGCIVSRHCLLVRLQALLFTCSTSSAVVYLFRFKLRCRCQTRLRATVLACQCLDQFVFIDQHLKSVVANCYGQNRRTNRSCLCAVECVYCCVFDFDHCVSFVCCCLVYVYCTRYAVACQVSIVVFPLHWLALPEDLIRRSVGCEASIAHLLHCRNQRLACGDVVLFHDPPGGCFEEVHASSLACCCCCCCCCCHVCIIPDTLSVVKPNPHLRHIIEGRDR